MSTTTENAGLQDQEFQEPEAAPPPEDQAPPEAAPQQPEEPARQVPLAELLKERQARKAAAEEAARLRQEYERGTQELAALKRLVEERLAPSQPPAQLPDMNTDPVGHFAAKTQSLEQVVAELRKEREQQTEAQRRAAQEQELVMRYVSANREYAATVPDWNDAYSHVVQGLIAEAKLMGANEAQAVEYAHATEKRLAQAAFTHGDNPGRAIYELAKARGYQGKAQRGAPPPAAEQVETMRRAQAARNPGSSNARAPGDYTGLSLAELANMPEEDFAKVPEPIKRRLLGG